MRIKKVVTASAWWTTLVVMTVITVFLGWVISMGGYPVLGTLAVVTSILTAAWIGHAKIHAGEDERP